MAALHLSHSGLAEDLSVHARALEDGELIANGPYEQPVAHIADMALVRACPLAHRRLEHFPSGLIASSWYVSCKDLLGLSDCLEGVIVGLLPVEGDGNRAGADHVGRR